MPSVDTSGYMAGRLSAARPHWMAAGPVASAGCHAKLRHGGHEKHQQEALRAGCSAGDALQRLPVPRSNPVPLSDPRARLVVDADVP